MSEGLSKILAKAEELFFQNGVKNTTMDDLATALGISKKTLYLTISNKDELVYRAIENHMAQEKQSVLKVAETSTNAIDEMLQIGKIVTKHMRNLNPTIIYDVHKYYPTAWQMINDYKDTFLYETILQNIKSGIEQGYYRSDVNPDIIAKIYSSKADCIVDQKLFPFTQYSIISVYYEYLRYHIRGIASDKGLKYIEQINWN